MKATQVRVLRLFFLLSYLAVCISAVGPLGIQWNKDMATRDGVQKMVWMSVIDFGTEIDEKTISNEQLAGLAKKAWNEMKADFDNKPWKDSGVSNSKAGQVPTVMVALTRGTKIYFSSSMRSCSDDKIGYAYSSILSPPPVQMGLYSCALLTENGDRHRTGGNCGEQMAAVLVFNDVSDGKQDLAGSRVCLIKLLFQPDLQKLTKIRWLPGSIIKMVVR